MALPNQPFRKIICVDFDGVLHSYTSGWKGAANIPDPPVPGALPWLISIAAKHSVNIYSARSGQGGIDAMKAWLIHHLGAHLDPDQAYTFVEMELEFPLAKPSAFLTIDDRAICFKGDFTELTPEYLSNFKAWWQK